MSAATNRSEPRLRSYLAASNAFASGADDPGRFLERCLETLATLEPPTSVRLCTSMSMLRAVRGSRSRRSTECRSASKTSSKRPTSRRNRGRRSFRDWRTNRDAASVVALCEAGAVVSS